jgi:hypothetical protein
LSGVDFFSKSAFEKVVPWPVNMDDRPAYDTDLTDAEWDRSEPLVPVAKPGGRAPKHTRREIVNGICYAIRSGGAWKLLPHDLPPWRTVYHSLLVLAPAGDLGADQ